MLPLASIRIATLAGLGSDHTLVSVRFWPSSNSSKSLDLRFGDQPSTRVAHQCGDRNLLDTALEDDDARLLRGGGRRDRRRQEREAQKFAHSDRLSGT